MFENIIDQETTVEQISREWRDGNLPRSMLFYGEPYSGKLSTALEIARVITCKTDGRWSCTCRSCRQHRVLDHPYLVLSGSRFLHEEIAAAADTLSRTRREGARFLFIRSLRKLTRRLDPLLWEGEEQKLSKVHSSQEDLEDAIEALYPENELPPDDELEKLIERCKSSARKISEVLPDDNIPIRQIRNIGQWSHTTSGSSSKVVILENADRMSDGSKNALLKMLEEPPEDTYFILLTTKKGAIIPTILSRLRQYRFVPRSEESAREVMEKIFRVQENAPYRDLRSFFLAWRGVPVEELRSEAEQFIERILIGEEWDTAEKDEFLKKRGNPELFYPFLEELSLELERRLRSFLSSTGTGMHGRTPKVSENEAGSLKTGVLNRWNELIRDMYRRWEAYNQNPAVLLESLYYEMENSREVNV